MKVLWKTRKQQFYKIVRHYELLTKKMAIWRKCIIQIDGKQIQLNNYKKNSL